MSINILYTHEYLVAKREEEGGKVIFADLQVYSSTGEFFWPPTHLSTGGMPRRQKNKEARMHCIWIEHLYDIFTT